MVMWIACVFAGIVAYYCYDIYRKQQYWKTKGLPSLFPYPLVGQLPQVMKMGQGKFDQYWTKELGRVFGYFNGSTPFVEISDTGILRDILVKDFSHFVDRLIPGGLGGDVMDQSILLLRGQRWKDMRHVLDPTFTSGKLRQMDTLISDCCASLVKNMEKIAENDEEYEAKELYGRVTLDIVAAVFFATKIDSMDDPQSEFVINAKKAFHQSPLRLIAFVFPKIVPLARKLGLELGAPKSAIEFFVQNTQEILRIRASNPSDSHKDFLQLMLKSLRTGNGPRNVGTRRTNNQSKEVEEDQTIDIVSQSITHSDKSTVTTRSNHKLTTEELVAQSVVFFLAGYETTATALAFLTYNLAIHPKIQEKLRQEILQVMTGRDEPTYDLIAQMPYLDACLNETLRLFPPLGRTFRKCTEDWNSNGLHIEKDTIVVIPVYAMQRDPEYWSNPDVFDPERFSPANKQNIRPYTFQAFGQGPRNCIGMRFAIYEIKMAMASILRKFRIVPSARTEIPLPLKALGFMYAKNGIWTKLEKL